MKTNTLTPDLLQKMDAYWRAANYLSVGQIYLYDNPLLKRPLTLADVKHMLLGHWGTTPGQNFIYAHLNRVIKKYDLDMIYVSGPGHGGPAVVGNTYLEGTYSEIYPNISQDEAGLRKLFFSFRFPAAFPATHRRNDPARSTRAANWAIRSAIRSARCSTIPISSSPASSAMARRKPGRWPRRGIPTSFSIRPPTARCCRSCISTATRFPTRRCSPASPARNWNSCCAATAGRPYFVEGHEPALMHEAMAATLDTAVEQIKKIQQDARVNGNLTRPRWPMIVLNSPKGWTGPKWWMACRLKAPSARIRCRSPIRPRIPNISSCWKTG
jgi:xylulose-5-phosphate/fructose-6-phosphate phosphoketolase